MLIHCSNAVFNSAIQCTLLAMRITYGGCVGSVVLGFRGYIALIILNGSPFAILCGKCVYGCLSCSFSVPFMVPSLMIAGNTAATLTLMTSQNFLTALPLTANFILLSTCGNAVETQTLVTSQISFTFNDLFHIVAHKW